MTRADPTGEPSMEDILASIRKIIAEDPPGSRPAPEPRPQPSPSQAFRALQRDSEAPAALAAPEPYLRSGLQSPPFQSMSAFPAASIPEPRHQHADPFAASPAAIATQPARSLSVDDQLSELLGEAPHSVTMAAPAAPASIARPVARSISAAPGFIAKMTAPTVLQAERDAQARHDAQANHEAHVGHGVQGQPLPAANGADFGASLAHAAGAPAVHTDHAETVKAQSEPAIAERAGFTVSRAGYIPESPVAGKQPNPFDFQLGPSPFAGKLYAADPVLPSATAPGGEPSLKASPADLGSIVPSRHFDFSELDEAPKSSLRVPRPVPGFEPRGDAHTAAARAERADPVVEIETAVAKPVAAVEPEPVAAPTADTAAATQAELPAVAIDTAEPVAAASSVPMPQVMTLETLLPPSAVAIAEASSLVETPSPIADLAAPVTTDESPAAQQGALAAEYLAEIEAMTPEVEAAEAAESQEISNGSMMFNGTQPDAARAQFTPAFAHQQVATYSEPNAPERSMEDTVAELLRPMLKNWLAENMPKIVERALRREIEESFALEHKPAAE